MTKIIPKNPDEIVPGSSEARDDMELYDWFPIFRSGNYPQGKFTSADLDEIVEEFNMTGRRPPMVFDHLTPADYEENAKPGSAAGYIVALRAVDETDPRYAGERLLEARAKAGWYARYRTREGATRNVSAAFYKCKSVQDGKKRFALHHLALLGAAPPGVNGLPEVVFSERDTVPSDEILRFEFEDGLPAPSTFSAGDSSSKRSAMDLKPKAASETISFTEHEALLGQRESDLRLEFSQKETATTTKVAELEGQVASFREKVSTLEAAAAAAESAKTLFGEQQRAAGVEEGKAVGRAEAEAEFNKKSERSEISVFCEGLRKSGRLTEAEFKGDEAKGLKPMAERLFAMSAEVRAEFKDLLSGRPGLTTDRVPAPSRAFSESPVPDSAAEEQALADEARELAREKNISFREARSMVISNRQKGG